MISQRRCLFLPSLWATLLLSFFALLPISTSPAAAAPCPNEQVREESDVNPLTGKSYSTELPDCRAYELVSSGDKNDVDVMLSPLDTPYHSGTADFGLVSEDGGRVLWEKEFELYSLPTNGSAGVYEATRSSSGWSQSDALAPPGAGSTEELYLGAASSDFSIVLLWSEEGEQGLGSKDKTELIERGTDGSYTTIVNVPYTGELHFAQLSGDGSHAFFRTTVQLAGDTHTEGRQVYEWTSAGGLHVVGVNDAGGPVNACGAALAGPASDPSNGDVSQDGSRVFFESPDPAENDRFEHKYGLPCGHPVELYVRENASTTVDISKAPPGAVECEPGVTECPATFVGATPEGSRVFFVTRSQLTPETTNTDPNLYEYDVETGALKRLSVGPPGYDDADLAIPAGATGNLANTAMISNDGSHVYFTGLGQLVPGAGASAATNEADDTVNLYVYANGSVSYIATVGRGNLEGEKSHREAPSAASLGADVAEVTPDGSDLIFDSDSQLTSYDNAGESELYRYDASRHTISCISCSPAFAVPNPSLEQTVFHTSFTPELPAVASIRQWGGLSDDGDTVFFASTAELLPAATNVLTAELNNPIYNIYEWHDGVLSLISTGTSPSSDFLVGASPSGSDVFFMSASQLVPQDGEHSYEIYDARSEGGFPVPTAPAPCASAETCRSMVATPPVTVQPASVSFTGPGDATPTLELPTSPAASGPRSKPLTRAQLLAKALKPCKKLKPSKRKACERAARKKYAVKSRFRKTK